MVTICAVIPKVCRYFIDVLRFGPGNWLDDPPSFNSRLQQRYAAMGSC
jgi:hypothetical protein